MIFNFVGLLLPFLKYWKIGLILLGLAGSGWGGYQIAKAHYEGLNNKALQSIIEEYEERLSENQRINQELREQIETVRGSERVVIEKVIKYVEANPDRLDCELDADGLQLWNSSGTP